MSREVWRSVPGFDGSYEISDQGRVKSVSRLIACNGNSNRRFPERILRPAASRSGHLTVVLGRGNTRQVHALVMLAFVGPKPSGTEILHLDHDPANNRLVNLKYGTRTENLRMDYDAERRKQAKPVVAIHPDGKRVRYKSTTDAAIAYGVTQSAASQILKVGGTLRKTKVRLIPCG